VALAPRALRCEARFVSLRDRHARYRSVIVTRDAAAPVFLDALASIAP